MKLSKRLESILDCPIDFSEFYLLDCWKTDSGKSVVVTGLKEPQDKPFEICISFDGDVIGRFTTIDLALIKLRTSRLASDRKLKSLLKLYNKRKEAAYA